MAETATLPAADQRYTWQGLTYTITRVARDGSWADITVEGVGGWTKRQPLPLPSGSMLIGVES
jgi:hypothetical protein